MFKEIKDESLGKFTIVDSEFEETVYSGALLMVNALF